MDQGDHGDHGAGCWTRSTVVLLLHFADVNLVVKGFLWGDDSVSIAGEGNEIHYSPEEELRQLREWRKKVPIGKLYNIIT